MGKRKEREIGERKRIRSANEGAPRDDGKRRVGPSSSEGLKVVKYVPICTICRSYAVNDKGSGISFVSQYSPQSESEKNPAANTHIATSILLNRRMTLGTFLSISRNPITRL